VKLDGPVLGTRTRDTVLSFYAERDVDCSGMTFDADFPGVEDLVLVDGHTRTIFGRFAHYHGSGENRWSEPDHQAIKAARAVSLDPGFGEASRQAAAWCAAFRTPFVTIDLRPDNIIHRQAAVSIISNEFLGSEYPGADIKKLFAEYAAGTGGLVMFTFGSKDIMFGRKNGPVRTFTPYKVAAQGSLAAGDFFRGGAVYAAAQGWPDERVVAFSAAVGALACVRFPAALNPPGLDNIFALMNA
jgi:sugar/nucleoside kinase (ribokinase family)